MDLVIWAKRKKKRGSWAELGQGLTWKIEYNRASETLFPLVLTEFERLKNKKAEYLQAIWKISFACHSD